MKLFCVVILCMVSKLIANESSILEMWYQEYEQISTEFVESIKSVKDKETAAIAVMKIKSLNNRLELQKRLWLLLDEKNLITDIERKRIVESSKKFFEKEIKNYVSAFIRLSEIYDKDRDIALILKTSIALNQLRGEEVERLINKDDT